MFAKNALYGVRYKLHMYPREPDGLYKKNISFAYKIMLYHTLYTPTDIQTIF